MKALERIELHGLAIIRDCNRYAVSIDDTGDEPTEEQRAECYWFDTPEAAAEQYIRRNADLFR